MTLTSTGRRARSAMALCVGAALLGLAACGPGTESPTAEPPGAGSDTSDGGGAAQEPPSDRTEDDETDASDATDDTGEDGAGADEGAGEDGAGATQSRTRLVLVTEPGVEGTQGDGAPVLASDELAALLGDSFDGSAECADELVLEPGAAAVGCVGPASIDAPEPTQEWVANVVMVPGEDGFQNGSSVAVLFSTGTELPEDADDLLDRDVVVTGVGVGTMFGTTPLSAAELSERTLETLTSENAYVPVHEMADWSDVTCEDGLDFSDFETVECEATTADGETWGLQVAPGTFANNDPGLLVGIEVPRGN